MAELWLVRHAQAAFGTENYDRLTELGWRQSRWLGEHFAERGIAFDRVARGTLRRHEETLAGICEALGPVPAAEPDAGLNEYDAESLLRAHTGLAEVRRGGDRREHFRVLREALYAWTEGALDARGTEPYEAFVAFRRRVMTALAEVRSSGARRVLMVSSGGPISLILAEVLGMPMRGVVDLNLRTRNTGVTEFHFNERAIHCVGFNAVPHLDRPDRPDVVTYS
ncbi:MAG TPA: histidine phosphatase family protein [Burkholderiales bacterium]|nr:histidine phosphatase family protein [Burkholderiales bacterium]